MNSEHYRQILNNEFKSKEMTPEDFDNTLMHFAKLVHDKAWEDGANTASNDVCSRL